MEDAISWANNFIRDALANILPRIFAGKCRSKARLDKKVVIITGSNAGLGRLTAQELFKRGARVIMACRNLNKANEAAAEIRKDLASFKNTGELVPRELDLASFRSIRACAEEILTTEQEIHLLVNNAGLLCSRELTEDGHEKQFGVHYLGHFLFSQLLLPRMLNSAPARIVNVTSLVYVFGDGDLHFEDMTLEHSYEPLHAYARSKLAIILFTKELARRLAGTGVTTFTVHPGFASTDFMRNYENAYSLRIRKIMESRLMKLIQKNTWQGTQSILHCCLQEGIEKENGHYFSNCRPIKPLKRARNEKTAKLLWDFSWGAVGLPEDYNSIVKNTGREIKMQRNLN